MKKYILLVIIMTLSGIVQAQNSFTAIVKDAGTKEVLIGASAIVKGTLNGGTVNEQGFVTIGNIPGGKQAIEFSYIGYEPQVREVTFPLASSDTVEIFLASDAEELEEVTITSTRSSRSIQNIPTRMEFIGGEELEEKGNMKPGDIRMLLNESTGIQTQQTSATSANASIRIQGLDGRYTQILKDGFPLYSGAASGLGLLQIPPLDLKQVEIIKGSSSTLYGGGAIAGLVNLISKTPNDERELGFHINGTSALGLDVSGFYAQKFKKVGLTVFASRNSNVAYDPADIDLTAIPKFERYNVNPRLFVYFSKRTKIDIGVNTAFENRLGGDMYYIKGEESADHSYFERNKTQRFSTQFSLEHQFTDKAKMNIRNSYNNFQRVITIPGYTFDGTQNGSFTELNYSYAGENTEWVTGANLWTDNFSEKPTSTFPLRSYDQLTAGVFVQNLTKATDWLSIESGARGDYVVDYGFAFLPRLSALFKINHKWTSRIGGGLGYKTPTIFTEESERIQYQNVLPINSNFNKLERSYGINADMNYHTMIGEHVSFSVNQLFFYTYLNSPLMLIPLTDGTMQFQNIDGNIETKGVETNVKIGYGDFKLFLGYTFVDAEVKQNGTTSQNPLTSKHRVNSVLMYEVENKWKIGLEAYYFGSQLLNDGTTGRDYWVCGAMVEKIWKYFSVYANFENFMDTRQTRFGSIYTGPITNPVFKDIYAPLDGFIASIGVKIKL